MQKRSLRKRSRKRSHRTRNLAILVTVTILVRLVYVQPIRPNHPAADNGVGKRFGTVFSGAREKHRIPNWNPHSEFPRTCGGATPQLPPHLQTFVENMWRGHAETANLPGPNQKTFEEIVQQQICQYETLDRMAAALKARGVTRYTASHGTSFGAHCFGR